mmetsp:Transcript_14110/g.32835  ORF Transcript_14110/g.32835 Transcript_14110/m.32835 type:complete len:299 (-) Transcript_14110:114-1010(-)
MKVDGHRAEETSQSSSRASYFREFILGGNLQQFDHFEDRLVLERTFQNKLITSPDLSCFHECHAGCNHHAACRSNGGNPVGGFAVATRFECPLAQLDDIKCPRSQLCRQFRIFQKTGYHFEGGHPRSAQSSGRSGIQPRQNDHVPNEAVQIDPLSTREPLSPAVTKNDAIDPNAPECGAQHRRYVGTRPVRIVVAGNLGCQAARYAQQFHQHPRQERRSGHQRRVPGRASQQRSQCMKQTQQVRGWNGRYHGERRMNAFRGIGGGKTTFAVPGNHCSEKSPGFFHRLWHRIVRGDHSF